MHLYVFFVVIAFSTPALAIDPIWLSPTMVGTYPEQFPEQGVWTNISVGAGLRANMPMVVMDSKKTLWMLFGRNSQAYSFNVWNYDPKTDLYRWVVGPGNSTEYLRNPGKLRVPSPDNWSGGIMYSPAPAIDSHDNIWYMTYDSRGEMWMFNTTSHLFTRMNGLYNTQSSDPVYGKNPGRPSEDVWPGGNVQACLIRDSKNNLWLIGGGANENRLYSNRIWHFNTTSNLWTFIGGNNTAVNTIYGDNPLYGNRYQQGCDIDEDDRIWLFGGRSYSASYNDVWSYDTKTTQWRLERGSGASVNAVATVTVADDFDVGNYPYAASTTNFIDRKDGTLLLVNSPKSQANDVWLFNKTSKLWKLIYGRTSWVPNLGNYSNYRMPGSIMPSRVNNGAANGLNIDGDVYMYGGLTNDVWLIPQDQCKNNIHKCSSDAQCIEEMIGYSCQCNDGFVGDGFTCTVPVPPTANEPLTPPLMAPLPIDTPQSSPTSDPQPDVTPQLQAPIIAPEVPVTQTPVKSDTPIRDSDTKVSHGEILVVALAQLVLICTLV